MQMREDTGEQSNISTEKNLQEYVVELDEVEEAVEKRDWERLRTLSLRTGGFGESRIKAWPFLLHARDSLPDKQDVLRDSQRHSGLRRRGRGHKRRRNVEGGDEREKVEEKGTSSSRSSSTSSDGRHADENQIKLDTDRSFVLYPVGDLRDREELQVKLNQLITAIFRRHPKLSYFQGYHDIITVLFLTLPLEEQFSCAEKMSLHRLRDSMGKGLEPLVGLLRILKFLLRLADPPFAKLLESNTPLPYFALSNLLTLFSHDVPTLPLIQHVFDFLLSRPPIASVYLAAAVVLARKEEAERIEEEGEDGMLYSLMSSLPDLVDGEADHGESRSPKPDEEEAGLEKPVPAPPQDFPPSEHTDLDAKPVDESLKEEAIDAELLDSSNIVPTTDGSGLNDQGIQPEGKIEEITSPASVTPPDQPHSSSPPRRNRQKRPPLSLTALLRHADDLFTQFPPTHPKLLVDSILGPKSVIFTWSEDPASLASDSEVESLVTAHELVVRPFIDPDEMSSKERERSPSPSEKRKRRRLARFLRRRRKGAASLKLNGKTVLTGAVVALGVAVAVYSVTSGPPLTRERATREWKKFGKWMGSAIIGGSERLLETFGW